MIKKQKVKLYRKGDMNTIIHNITDACPNDAAFPVRGSICLASPDLGRFGGGAYIYRRICGTLPLASRTLGTSDR